MNRLLLQVSSVGLLTALLGCGGGGDGSRPPTTPTVPTPAPTQAALTRTVLDTRDFVLRRGAGFFFNQDRLPEGALDVTMNWQNGDIPVGLYITPANTCPDISSVAAGFCQILAKSDDPKAKPKILNYAIGADRPSVAVWVINLGVATTDASLEVGLTSRETPATPAPGATPADPRAGLADGPVASAFIKVRSIDQGNQRYRDPFQDRDGFWVVHPNEFVVFDMTQKNANNQECKWINDPSWEVEDPASVFALRGSSQPFLLRTDVTKDDGVVEVVGTIDGVASNVLRIKAKKP